MTEETKGKKKLKNKKQQKNKQKTVCTGVILTRSKAADHMPRLKDCKTAETRVTEHVYI